MKQYILSSIAVLALIVSCNTKADDGVGEIPKENTEKILYFQFTKDRGTHSISVEERQEKTLTIEGLKDGAFEATENSGGAISLSKTTNPAKLTIRAYKVGEYPVSIKGTDTDGVKKTITLYVKVTERDTGWKNGVYTVENIDGDMTEKDSKGYVEFESLGYNLFQNDIQPASARDKIQVSANGGIIRVTAQKHYDESIPITFSVKNAAGDTHTVHVRRVTKFWELRSSTEVIGIDPNTTKNSFDKLSVPPKTPYSVTHINGLHYYELHKNNPYYGFDKKSIAVNTNITKIDLNRIKYIYGVSFSGCTNLTEVIANNVETISSDYAFANTKLTKIDLPAIKSIGAYAFNGTPITTVKLGKNLTTLYANALKGIEGTLLELRIESSTPSGVTLVTDFIGETQARLLVPNASLADWNSRYPWLKDKFKGGVQGY
ncbi:leucine-rich repeat domain-containing protein [Capnocytophaga catalasegens]|uniref:Leucine-rich repeat domain-containing protein n=1 Tax=Capnocytophaga catalasegens TaxID=1004260 RepID=A0AAV5B071_9FLAO|nr:leucine-rich repeat domain-containing protein [Capnocytophaga catalasegens]GIZ14294.1 hypothetical protein RCZ03_02950 [Capnocytophaga catalasegens]GJM51291.1 hypothetical protein RCZ15_22640 [Capnocytophaga catalasegens]GJM53292.1 hypothetical protein RCZ16_16090 [Capnocytophaga catalasegens]